MSTLPTIPPIINIPSPVISYPTNIPEFYSNYIKNEYDLLNKEYDSTNNNSQESITNLTSTINIFTNINISTIQKLIEQYAKPIINNTSPKSSADPNDTSSALSSLITIYLQTKRDFLRAIKLYFDDIIVYNKSFLSYNTAVINNTFLKCVFFCIMLPVNGEKINHITSRNA
jgi:hypothetical protein